MGFHYLTFMGRNLENREKLRHVHTMNRADLCSKNIVNSVGVFSDSVSIDSMYREYY